MTTVATAAPVAGAKPLSAFLQLLLISSIGVIAFFIPITIQGKSSVILDHITSWMVLQQRLITLAIVLSLMAYGTLSLFARIEFSLTTRHAKLHWSPQFHSVSLVIFSVFRLLGMALVLLYLLGALPEWAMEKNMMPFLFDKLVLTVGILIPLGALMLTFLLGFGLLESLGVLMEPLMRPLFRTPGYSAVDAVSSFVGSYSIGLLITNKLYSNGRYSIRDAAIIATGFSTASVTFMVVIANTLQLMPHWNLYFWTTFIVAFVSTSITAYLPPLSRLPHGPILETVLQQSTHTTSIVKRAIESGVEAYTGRHKLFDMLWANFCDGLRMTTILLPSILSIGLTGLVIAKFTPLFDYLGYVLLPALWLASWISQDTTLINYGGDFASGLAEILLPALLMAEASIEVRFIAAVTSVSAVLFLSGCIPCIMATKIPLKFSTMLSLWWLRTSLSIVLTALCLVLWKIFGWIG